MKKKYIATIIVIAVAIVIIVSMAGDASTYVSFSEAKKMAENGYKNSIHVVGVLPKNEQGQVVGIQESPDKLSFKFEMVDENGFKQEVLFPEPVPIDFTKSEQVVIVGNYNGGNFVADKILLKCPSKYQEEPDLSAGI